MIGAGGGSGSGGGAAPAPRLRPLSVAGAFFALLAFVADAVTDIVLVVDYWIREHVYLSIGTLSLIVVSAVVVQTFSMRWFVLDEKATARHWLTHVLCLGVVHRHVSILRTAYQIMKSDSQHDVREFYSQQSDVCMLHLFESFLEAAPQLILQLYVMVALEDWRIFTGVSALASLASLSWAIVNYLRVLRRARPDKLCMRNPALILQVTWRGSLLLARISALLLFAVGFHQWIFVLFGIHWLTMTIWVIHQKTDFCPSQPEEIFYNCVVGIIYCFCFFNLKEGQSRYRMFIFYTIMVIENITCLLLFFFLSEPNLMMKELIIVASSLIVIGITIGLSSMLIFYRWFHPAGHIKLWTKKQDLHAHDSANAQSIDANPKNSNPNDSADYTLRSLKKPWLDGTDNEIKSDAVCLENSPQSEIECTDKKLLLDHWIARAGSPTFASVPIDKTTESPNVTGVEFYSVTNTPENYSKHINTSSKTIKKNILSPNELFENSSKCRIKIKRQGICPPLEFSIKVSDNKKNETYLKKPPDIDSTTKKRRGICSSGQLEEEIEKENSKNNLMKNFTLVGEISVKDDFDHQCNLANEKSSSDSINLDLDLSFSDINSSDINEFNENIVQKLCLSTLKNIKNVHQDADIQNIQRIALEILKDLYSKGGIKDDQELESELSSSFGRDLETPSEVLSTHDYENICAVNIAREAWGLRSWRGCTDMGASPPPPPLPARTNISHNINRDQYINTVAYELSRCEGNDCQHMEVSNYKETDPPIFIAKPYVVDQNGGIFPLPTMLEPILEEIDEIVDPNSTLRKHPKHCSESTLVATIDEIRHDTVTNSPRNVYHRAEWDSPVPSLNKDELRGVDQNNLMNSNMRKKLWKNHPLFDKDVPHNEKQNNEMQKNIADNFMCKNKDTLNMHDIRKPYNNSFNLYPKTSNITCGKLKTDDQLNERTKVTLQDMKAQQNRETFKMNSKLKSVVEEVTNIPNPQEHNLSYEEVVFLSQLVCDSDSFPLKKESNVLSLDDISNIGISSSLQSLVDKDNHSNLSNVKMSDGKLNNKRSGNKPRRKFSLLREKFELKSKHSDEEMLFQSLESIKSVSHNYLDIASSHSDTNSNMCTKNEEIKIKFDKENLTPPIKVDNKAALSIEESESVVLSLTPCDTPQTYSNIMNLKEKRSIFLKQVLSPPKINSCNKKS